MHLPEQDLFSLKAIALRWNKSVSYVQDLTRRGVLPMDQADVKVAGPRGCQRIKLVPHVRRADLEEFEKASGVRAGLWKHLKEAAVLYDVSEKTLRRRVKDKKVKSRRDPGGRLLIFCPVDL